MKALAALPKVADSEHIAAWAVKLGRLGLAARGIVYLMVGCLALAWAAGRGGKLTDKQGALGEIHRLPYGHAILWVVAIGLIGYVAWRLAQGVLDLDKNGKDAKGLAKRVGSVCSGLAYAGLSTAALTAALGRPFLKIGGHGHARGSDAAAQDWTAWLISKPFGQVLVGLAAVVVGGIALYQFYQAISCRFTHRLRGGGLSKHQEDWSRRAGQLGYMARGIAFGLISGFLMKAAIHQDARSAGGLVRAFRTLAEQPHGMWLLGAVGLGTALFGVFSMVEARYRRFR